MKRVAVQSFLVAAVLLVLGAIAEAQQPKNVPRIAYLSSNDPASESTRAEEIRLALRALGYIEGQNIAVEYRYAEGKIDRLSELAAELVRLKVDVIVAAGGVLTIRPAMNATKTIPIVMVGGGADPVKEGLVESLAVPAATSPALQGLAESWAASGWSCSKKQFQNLFVSRFPTIRPLRPVKSR
jgi:putative tryptophan/tyrosine transport system substrate-binding protein